MPLSSSSVDRRIPEALSTSRKRNLIVEGQHLPDAGAAIAAYLAPRAVRRPSLAGIPQANLRRPRGAPQRLRRLAEGADKGASHPVRVAKPGDLRDAFARLTGALHALPWDKS